MIDQTIPAIQKLARKQQRKLWLERLLTQAYLPFGWLALVLLIGGIIHQGLQPMAPYPTLVIACTPLILYAFFAYLKRPNRIEAVTRTDSQLEAHALFIAVWEMADSPHPDTAVYPLLLSRAKQQLPQWNLRLTQQQYPRPDSRLLITLALMVIGGFLLLLPGKPSELTMEAAALQKQQSLSAEAPDPVAEINEILLQEQIALSAPALQKAHEPSPAGQPQDALRADPIDSNRQEPAETSTSVSTQGPLQPSESEELLIGTLQQAANVGKRHRAAGTQGWDNGAPTNDSPVQAEAAQFRQQRAVEIQIEEATGPQVFNSLQGTQVNQEQQGPSARVIHPHQASAGQPGSQLASHRMTPEQRFLVIRYLEHLSHSHETTP